MLNLLGCNKSDFIKARAETDSTALKKKFSDNYIYKKNLPNNSNCKSLYAITEKIRYETLGGKMLKGIEKNFKDNDYRDVLNDGVEEYTTNVDYLNNINVLGLGDRFAATVLNYMTISKLHISDLVNRSHMDMTTWLERR